MELITDWDGVLTYAVFMEEIPTADELELVRRNGYGIRIARLPDFYDNYDFLEATIPWLQNLNLTHVYQRDARILERFTELRTLSVGGGTAQSVDLSRLRHLRKYFGPHEKFESLEGLTSLRAVTLYPPITDRIAFFQSPLEEFGLVARRNMKNVPVIAHPSKTRLLDIDGARDLDITNVESYPNLEKLSLSGITRLSGVEVLLRMPSLKELRFERCPTIANVEVLLEMEGVRVSVEARNSFDDSFREIAAKSGSMWDFPRLRGGAGPGK